MNANVQDLTNTVLEDKELVSMLEQSADANEVSELLAKKGIKIEAKTIDAFMEQQVGQGELSESELENVAGGKFKLRYLNPVYWVGRLLAYAITKDMCD